MINFYAPINPTGYGIHASNLIFNYMQIADCCLMPIGNFQPQEQMKDPFINAINRGRLEYNQNNPSICLWHANDMSKFRGSPLIGYTVTELDRLNDSEIHHLNQLDYVIVPSHWAEEIYQEQLDISVSIIPEGVNNQIYQWEEMELTDSPMYLNIGKFEVRKGHLHILDMMSKGMVNINLIAHWSNFFIPKEKIYSALVNFGFKEKGTFKVPFNKSFNPPSLPRFEHENGNVIYLSIDHNSDPLYIRNLIDCADIGLFPYSSEGWCLPLMECMSRGLPCIATNYSGPTEYINKHNSVLIEPGPPIPAHDGVFFKGDGNWASVDVETLADLVNSFGKDQERYQNINADLEDFGKLWSWKESAKKLHDLILELK
jgi:glycosyltransferase involved in cell wall biosynthesis